MSLLGVLRGMDAAHLQESGVDASLQRVRLLQGQMEKVLLATLGHSARDDALDRAVVQAAQVLGLPLVPSGHTQQGQLKQGDTGQGQQLVQQQQRQLNSGLDFGQPNAGPGPTSHKEGCSSGAAQQAGGMQPHGICNEHDWLSRPPAASGGGSTQGQQQDDLLQGLEDNDWDRLPAFTPPPDFS
uniref:Uncharacterized protein n=1 Tax=Dunaliella tertiolecta TaxID=3047 RepID=A0A7S3QVZ0_DUNTE